MGLVIPKEAQVDYVIPKEKIGFPEEIGAMVDEVRWVGTLKPVNMRVEAVVTPTKRFEEIQIICVTVNSIDDIFMVGQQLFKNIRYSVLLQICYKNKYLLGTCMFHPGVNDSNENILHGIKYSHWLHDENLSDKAKMMLNNISSILTRETDLYSMYQNLENEIEAYRLGGTSRAHVDRIICDMLGKVPKKEMDRILEQCTPYAFHIPIGDRYSDKRCKNYSLIHDYEELWYCFMSDMRLRKIIIARRYRDMEDLIYSIDGKEW